jgi:ATPase
MSRQPGFYIVPDFSAVANQKVLGFLDEQETMSVATTVILPARLLGHVEALGNAQDPSGTLALDHLAALHDRSEAGRFTLTITSDQDAGKEVSLEKACRAVAQEYDAVLVTCDPIQVMMCKIEGIKVACLEVHLDAPVDAIFGSLFDDTTMSVHLVEDLVPRGKKGAPGAWELVQIGDKPTSKDDLTRMTNEIVNLTTIKGQARGFLEIDYGGAKVVQFGNYRIAIAYPPVSKHYEITVTRPLVKKELDQYDLPEDLVERFLREADGILISGSPGAGKSTFASALANFYASHHKIVKTLESVRDLQVDPEITQYGAIEGEMEKNADLLLLVRPDYTIFDEVRRTKDFEIFADLRQAGVGMVGVVHASSPIDAIQRFISRIDLGILPQIIDTVCHIKDGKIKDILGVRMVVKIPKGFRDEGLARPVVEVFSFFNQHRVLYEIYTFGENTVVVPVDRFASKNYGPEARRGNFSPRSRDGGFNSRQDDELGNEREERGGPEDLLPVGGMHESATTVEFFLGRQAANRPVSIHLDTGEPILYGTATSNGILRIKRKSKMGQRLEIILRHTKAFLYRIQD